MCTPQIVTIRHGLGRQAQLGSPPRLFYSQCLGYFGTSGVRDHVNFFVEPLNPALLLRLVFLNVNESAWKRIHYKVYSRYEFNSCGCGLYSLATYVVHRIPKKGVAAVPKLGGAARACKFCSARCSNPATCWSQYLGSSQGAIEYGA